MTEYKKLPLSVALISFNEEDDIANTLDSIRDIASEIIVVDSHSTDRTCEIARGYGAKVFQEEWKGHIAQKNSAFDKCGEEWILSLDCDEVVTGELKASIVRAIETGGADGYYINRRTVYLGKLLKHAWQPDWKLRLVKRSAGPRWEGYNPHDVLRIKGTTERLRGDLLHYSYRDIHDHFGKVVTYSRIVADSYREQGKKFRIYNLIFNPPYAFVKEYLLKAGVLDGFRGFLVALSVSLYTFLKYLYLWEIERAGQE